MKNFTCIVCPNGCNLCIDESSLEVTGNTCKRGIDFAKNELTHPMRTIATTVRTSFKECPVISVRVTSDIPKEKIFDCMKEINKTVVSKKVKCGDVIIKNILGLGVDVIATTSRLMEVK